MKKRRSLLKRALALTAAVVLAFSAYWAASAVFSEEEAVHITPSEIEDSTLIVGTHLIHLSALSDSIYEIAQKSAEESGQSSMYYKSELANGAWFDITSASSLEDITTGGTPVEDSVIEALFFTHHTRSDGVTYDLRTGQAVDPRDIYDPYDLESMEELYPLKLQYDLIRESQSGSEAGQQKINRIADFFQTEVTNETTQQLEQQMDALQAYYNVLEENGGGQQEKAKVQEVLDALDASRRVQVFTILDTELNSYMQELSTMEDSVTEGEDGSTSTEAASAVDTELLSAVSDSLNNVRTSQIEYEGKMLAEGTTTASRTEYQLSSRLVTDAEAGNHSACDSDVAQLISLDNILSDIIADQEAENAILDDLLIPSSTDVYTQALFAGVNAEYTAAQAQNSASVVLDGIARNNTSLLNSYRNELEFFLTARTNRMGSEEGVAYIDERLALTEGWSPSVPEDAFQSGADSSISDHIEFLTQLRRQLELAAGGNEADALIAEKASLQEQMMECLDGNDLAGAQALEDQIAEIDSQLAEMDVSDVEGTLGSQVANARKAGLDALENGDADTLLDSVNTLGSLMELDPAAAFPAAQELHSAIAAEQALNNATAYDGAMAALETAILENADAYNAAVSAQLTADQLLALLQQLMAESGLTNTGTGSGTGGSGSSSSSGGAGGSGTGGAGSGSSSGSGSSGAGSSSGGGAGSGSIGSGSGSGGGLLGAVDSESAGAALAALQLYYDQTKSDAALTLLSSLSLNEASLGNPLVYLRVNDGGQEYVPVNAVSELTNLRYVWNSNLSTATLARGSEYYVFTLFSDAVQRGRDESSLEYMTQAAKSQNGVIQIHESYAEENFSIGALYLTGTQYGVAYSEEMYQTAQDLLAALLDAA